MKAILKRLAVGLAAPAVTLCLGASIAGEQPGSDEVGAKEERQKLSDDELFDAYYAFIEKVKPYGIPLDREEHKKVLAPKILGWVDEEGLTGTKCAVTVGSNRLTVKVDGYTGHVRMYSHNELFVIGEGVRAKYSPAKVRPGLSEKDVIERLAPYLTLSRELALEDCKPQLEYQGNNWYVLFRRRLGDFVYSRDAIIMHYSEEYGLLFYLDTWFSDECDTNAKITAKQGGELAAKCIAVFAENQGYRGAFSSVGDGRFVIINPARYQGPLQAQEDVIPVAELRKTRLVWWESFRNRTAGVRIVICVDAITGELLCYEVISKW